MRKPRTFKVIVLSHQLIMPEIFYKQNMYTMRTEIRPTRGLMTWFRNRERNSAYVAAFSLNAAYYYYRCGGERDTGWGCAYRCVQMMLDCIQRVFCITGCKHKTEEFSKKFASDAAEKFRMPCIRDMQVCYVTELFVMHKWSVCNVLRSSLPITQQNYTCTRKRLCVLAVCNVATSVPASG